MFRKSFFTFLFLFSTLQLFTQIIPTTPSNESRTCSIIKLTPSTESLSPSSDLKLFSNQSNLSFRVISFNTWGLPVGKAKRNLKVRLRNLSDSLMQYKADIIGLQEMFKHKIREKYIQGMIDEGYFPNENYLCSQRSAVICRHDCYGGLMILSKHPIVRQHFFPFPKKKGMIFYEKLGNKGVMYAIIDAPIGKICVINTHLYAGRSGKAEAHRLHQIEYIQQIITVEKLNEFPILFIGDFNVEHPDITKAGNSKSTVYPYVLNEMGFTDTVESVGANMLTYSKELNDWAHPASGQQKLDYIFYKANDLSIQQKETKVIFNKGDFLSDHFGLFSEFDIGL